MEKIIYTLIVAGIGGYIGIKIKMPAGAFVGAMFAVAIFNMTTGKGDLPIQFKTIAQIVVGGMIGLNFGTDKIASFKGLLLPSSAYITLPLDFDILSLP